MFKNNKLIGGLYFDVPGKYKTTLTTGLYKFECWGAQGGSGCANGQITVSGGAGAYVSGELLLREEKTIYLYVGGKGGDGSKISNTQAEGGYNGGGKGGKDTHDDDGSGGGGGASDIRLVDDDSSATIQSLQSRFIVAAGGSGSGFGAYGAPGGGLSGYIKTGTGRDDITESTTNQEHGNALGIGGDGIPHVNVPSSGGGGGYYGGEAVPGNYSDVKAVSSSGSSYVSGFDGCKPLSEIVLKNAQIIDGSKDVPFPNKSGTEKGHSGNGAIKITLFTSQSKCKCNETSLHFVVFIFVSILL